MCVNPIALLHLPIAVLPPINTISALFDAYFVEQFDCPSTGMNVLVESFIIIKRKFVK